MSSENKDNKRILSDMSLQEALFRCGELQLSYEDTCTLLAQKTDPVGLLGQLQDPDSEAHAWYRQGVAEGNLKLNIDLEENVGDPKAKDAYKNLSAERTRQSVNKKLKDLFGL